MSDEAGYAGLFFMLVGICMTFHRHLTGRIVGALMVLVPLALMFADDWLH